MAALGGKLTLSGPPGFGQSALLLSIAQRNLHHRPDAFKMSAAISRGCEISDTWLDRISTVSALMRKAM
jgi:hypothetical protein